MAKSYKIKGDNYIDDTAIQRNCITCCLTEDYTTQASNTYEVLPLNKEIISLGTKLTVNQYGHIVVGKGVSAVRVDGQAYFYTGTVNSSTSKAIAIYKNTGRVVVENRIITNQYRTITTASKVIPVKEGDLIKLAVQCTAKDVYKAYDEATFLSVEVIN